MFSGGMYIALASPFLILIAPVPFMILEIRQGLRESLLGILFGSVFVFMLFEASLLLCMPWSLVFWA